MLSPKTSDLSQAEKRSFRAEYLNSFFGVSSVFSQAGQVCSEAWIGEGHLHNRVRHIRLQAAPQVTIVGRQCVAHLSLNGHFDVRPNAAFLCTTGVQNCAKVAGLIPRDPEAIGESRGTHRGSLPCLPEGPLLEAVRRLDTMEQTERTFAVLSSGNAFGVLGPAE